MKAFRFPSFLNLDFCAVFMIVEYKNLYKKKKQHKMYVFVDDELNESMTRIMRNI